MKGRKKMNILFQGDSLTDSGRIRNTEEPNINLGMGYVNLLAARITCDNPSVNVYNRGVSGNRICDMYARWIEDTLNIDFDILSVMNGINDIGFQLRMGRGADKDKFKFVYDRMLFEVKEKKPDAKLVIIEPFLVRKYMGEDGGDIYNDWDLWHGQITERGEICRELAEKYGAIFVPLAEDFAKLSEKYGPDVWSMDCIHPTAAGHEVIARKWMEACKSIL